MAGMNLPIITLLEPSINPPCLLFPKYTMSDCRCPTTGAGYMSDSVLDCFSWAWSLPELLSLLHNHSVLSLFKISKK